MAPSRDSWSFSIHLYMYWDFSKSWSQIQKVGVNYSKFGVNETPAIMVSRRSGSLGSLKKKFKFYLVSTP